MLKGLICYVVNENRCVIRLCYTNKVAALLFHICHSKVRCFFRVFLPRPKRLEAKKATKEIRNSLCNRERHTEKIGKGKMNVTRAEN